MRRRRRCLPGARVDDIRKRVGQVMGPGTRGSICMHVGTKTIVGKFREFGSLRGS